MNQAGTATDLREQARAKLIVALDLANGDEAREVAKRLSGQVGMFKVGSQLFTAAGPAIVRELITSGERVFLDLKFHDIPNTVAAASVQATLLGVSIFNIHATNGAETMLRTRAAVDEVVAKEGIQKPAVIAVTALTSLDDATMGQIGVSDSVPEQVIRLAQLTNSAGLDGVVASPREIAMVRAAVTNEGFLIVTPGVRPAGAAQDDQKRVMSARDAIAAGADYLVIGRPVLAAQDPIAAIEAIVSEMADGLALK